MTHPTKSWQGYGVIEILMHYWWECKMQQTLKITLWVSSKCQQISTVFYISHEFQNKLKSVIILSEKSHIRKVEHIVLFNSSKYSRKCQLSIVRDPSLGMGEHHGEIVYRISLD